ncbi:MAG: tetratricopeptide repeat protein [Pseudomonadota bacterium]
MKKIGRNDPCPCGSGKKNKQCCGPRENFQSVKLRSVNVSPPVPLQDALAHHQAGRLPEAEAIYRQILQMQPNDADAHHLLGVIAIQVGKSEVAIELIGKALKLRPDFPEAYINLGNALSDQNRLDEAIACYRQAIKFKSDAAEAHNNLGMALRDQGKLSDAIACYRQAITFKSNNPEAYVNLGNALKEQGKIDEAIACYHQAIQCKPDFADAHNSLGIALKNQGKINEAIICYRQILTFQPDNAAAHNNLGAAYKDQGKLEEAIGCYGVAIKYKSDFAEAYINLGNALKVQGKLDQAVACLKHSLAIKETIEAKIDFAACIKNVSFTQDDPENRQLIIRALSEPWGRPADLAGTGINILKLNQNMSECTERAAQTWPTRLSAQELYGSSGFSSVADDRLLQCLLENVPICDVELERFLTMARLAMLNATIGPAVSVEPNEQIFYCALARQCFINEYIFSYTDEEFDQAQSLRERVVTAIAAKSSVPAAWLISVAAYFPLFSLPTIEALFDQSWPEAVNALLVQQIREPREEQQYRAQIPRLTPIDDEVSLLVQQQYEENPYPRWIKCQQRDNHLSLEAYLRQQFPFAPIKPLEKNDAIDILIAGCGTGWQSIQTAQQFRQSRVLAIDLSVTSLCYAKRKTHELGLENIEYACADITKLESSGRTFDAIESIGVLHHLADPKAGWQMLLSLLRPNGFMRLGFYSEYARRNIIAARQFIDQQGYAGNAADIRRCRQDLISMKDNEQFKKLLSFNDFYGTSECRDLLFHVHEHHFTLPQIKKILEEFDLEFIGFFLEAHVTQKYEVRFADDTSKTNLDYWNIFETENPDIFSGMYQFVVQKRG